MSENIKEKYFLEESAQTLVCLINLMKLPLAKTYSSKTKKELKKETALRKIPTDDFSKDMLVLALVYDDLYKICNAEQESGDK